MTHSLQKLIAVFTYNVVNWELPAKEIAEQYYRALQSAGQSQSKHEEKKNQMKRQ